MTDFRTGIYKSLKRIISASDSELPGLLRQHLSADVIWDVAWPINRLQGIDEVYEGFFRPLRHALSHSRRRDEIFIGARDRLDGKSDWVATVTHYAGNFDNQLIGIEATKSLVFLRAGEFYRIENDRIVEAKILIDLLDLLRQADRFLLPQVLGTEMLFPGPATHDGVLPGGGERGAESLGLVEAMLADLMVFDPVTLSSARQTGEGGYWHEDMFWYGPAGIGSNYRWTGFEKDHRVPFLRAFPDRKGGNHFCRIGDGDYAAVGGWPSMTATHKGDYLGVTATNKAVTLRVMDFYRCGGRKIMGNWVLLDYLDLFNQMGVDLLAKAKQMK